MKVGKPTSKRTSARLKYKIQKRSSSKQRKERKLAKKNPQWKSRQRKDPGIPNSFPFKDQLLHEAEERKRLREEEAARVKERNKEAKREAKKQLQREAGKEVEEDETGDNAEKDDDAHNDEDEDETGAPGLVEAGEDDDDGGNPMAALVASARARAEGSAA